MKKYISFTNRINLLGGANLQPVIPIDVPFLVRRLTANNTAGNFSCQMKLAGRPMSLQRIQQNNHFGISTLPCILTAPGYVPAGSEITLDILNLVALPNTVEVTVHGVTGSEAELAELSDNFKNFPYFYSGNIALGAGVAAPMLITTEADFPFRAIKSIALSTGVFDARIDVNGDCLTRQFMRNLSLFGTAQLPLAMDPYDIAAKSSIKIDLLDTSGFANAIEIVLMGHKVLK